MKPLLQPWQLLLLILAGWINSRQQEAIDYLLKENRVLNQAARNPSDAEDGFLRGKKYLLMDRDAKFSEAFRVTLKQVGTEAVRLPPRSPDLNPNLERFMRSIQEECLQRMVFFGERSLQVAVVAFLAHYHAARQAATKERFKPDLPKRLAALREKGGLKISFRFEKNLTVSSAERNHQALDNRLIDPGEEVGRTTGEVACRERLGGILRHYYRKAA
jgi:hypothetical protein